LTKPCAEIEDADPIPQDHDTADPEDAEEDVKLTATEWLITIGTGLILLALLVLQGLRTYWTMKYVDPGGRPLF